MAKTKFLNWLCLLLVILFISGFSVVIFKSAKNRWKDFRKESEEKQLFTQETQELIKNKGDINKPIDDRGTTRLHKAILYENYRLSRIILENGANANAIDDNSQTPLNYAVSASNPELVTLLLKYGASPCECDDFPLLYIAQKNVLSSNDFKIAELLLKVGSDINIQETLTRATPLHYAVIDDNPKLARFLLEHGADTTLKLGNNVKSHEIEQMEFAFDPNKGKDVSEKSPIELAKSKKMHELLQKYLIHINQIDKKRKEYFRLVDDERVKFLNIPNDVTNVALRKSVSSTDNSPQIGVIKMITDGYLDVVDGYVELGPYKQYITIDLEGEYELLYIIFWHYYKLPRVYFDVIVQVSNDPDFVNGVTTLFNNDNDNSYGLGAGTDKNYRETKVGKLINANSIKARYLRLHSNGNSDNDLNHYIEVAVYGRSIN